MTIHFTRQNKNTMQGYYIICEKSCVRKYIIYLSTTCTYRHHFQRKLPSLDFTYIPNLLLMVIIDYVHGFVVMLKYGKPL